MTDSIHTDTSVLAEFFSTTGPEDIYRPGEHPRQRRNKMSTRIRRVCKDVTSVLHSASPTKARAKFSRNELPERSVTKSRPIIALHNDLDSFLNVGKAPREEGLASERKTSLISSVPYMNTSISSKQSQSVSRECRQPLLQGSSYFTNESVQFAPIQHHPRFSHQLSPKNVLAGYETEATRTVASSETQLWPVDSQRRGQVLNDGLASSFRTQSDMPLNDNDHFNRGGMPLTSQKFEMDRRSSCDSEASLSQSLRMLDFLSKKENSHGQHIGSPKLVEVRNAKHRLDFERSPPRLYLESEQACDISDWPTLSESAVPSSFRFQPTVPDSALPSKPQSFTGRLRQAAASKSTLRTNNVDAELAGPHSASLPCIDDPSIICKHDVNSANFPVLLCQPPSRVIDRKDVLGISHQLSASKIIPNIQQSTDRDNSTLVARLRTLEDRNIDLERTLLHMLSLQEKDDWTDRSLDSISEHAER